jgi:beta-phosphoglucomutase
MQWVGDSKEELYRKLVHQGDLKPLPGVMEWVRRLREQGWRQAVASSAPRKNIEVVLEVLGMASFFDALVSAEDVTAGKPDPQVFQKGAQRLGMPASRCIVVEDAVPGVEAARRAGMRCIGVSRKGLLTGADVVVRSLVDLPIGTFEELSHR